MEDVPRRRVIGVETSKWSRTDPAHLLPATSHPCIEYRLRIDGSACHPLEPIDKARFFCEPRASEKDGETIAENF